MFSALSSRKKLKMAKTPIWTKSLAEVLGYQTQKLMKKSARTGNTYEVDVIPRIELLCMGEPEVVEKDNQKTYRYSVFDMKKNLEYKVSCQQYLKIAGVKQVIFGNLYGGSLSSGRGWYKADSIQLAVKK